MQVTTAKWVPIPLPNPQTQGQKHKGEKWFNLFEALKGSNQDGEVIILGTIEKEK